MSRATPKMRELSQRLVAEEMKGEKSVVDEAVAPFFIYEKLRPHLSILMGKMGTRALFSRSLSLSRLELPYLLSVTVSDEGLLAGFDTAEASLSFQEIFEYRIVLVAHLIGLLVAFIGSNLTLRLLRERWPELTFKDLEP